MNEDQAKNAFLRRYLSDRAAGIRRTSAEYQADAPDRAAEIAAWFARYERAAEDDGADDAESDEPESGETDRIGRFRILREIGRGGQGAVYLAEDETLRRPVAVKVLTGLSGLSTSRIRRFLREAEVASRLEHPGIAAVYEFGADGGAPFIAMRYVEGRSLATLVAERPAAADVVRIVARVARALHFAHERGVVHRDVKPANVMLTPSGDPVVLDFGLAQDADDRADRTAGTVTGEAFGTPAYMSPEQIEARGLRPDRRTDVWSLGVSLYELLAGMRPFAAPTREGLYRAVLTEEPRDIRRVAPHVSHDLAAVVETALCKDVGRRYADAAAMAADLEAVLDGRPPAARRLGVFGRALRRAQREPVRAAFLALALATTPTIAALLATRAADRKTVEAALRVRRAAEQDELLARAAFEAGEGDLRVALTLYREAFALARSPEALAGVVLAARRLGRVDEAATFLAAHRDAVRGSRIETLADAVVFTATGRHAEAEEALRRLPPPRSAADYYVEGDRLLEEAHAGDPAAAAEALRAFRIAILRSPGPRASYYAAAAHAAFHAGDAQAGREFADAVRAQWPDSAVGAFWAGAAYSLSNADEATAAYRAAIALRPDHAAAHCNLGVELSKRGLVEDAILAYRAALALDPLFYEPRRNLAAALEEAGRPDDALRELREAVRVRPAEGGARHALAAALDARGASAEALDQYREAVRLEPRSGRFRTSMGDALLRSGRAAEAVDALRAAAASDAKDADARNALGAALAVAGRTEEARAAFAEAVALRPEFPEARCNLGRAFVTLGRFAEGLAELRRGHEQAQRRKDWTYPSAEWVAGAEAAVRDEARMAAVAAGDAEPEGRAELASLASVAAMTRRWTTAARLYADAFEAPPSDVPDEPDLNAAAARAALAAASAARSESRAVATGERDPAAWRRFARERLTADVALLRAAVAEGNAASPDAVARKEALDSVLADPLFAPVRDAFAEETSAEERRAWEALWADLRAATRDG